MPMSLAADWNAWPAGVFGLIVGFFLLALVIAWALFPFLVLSKFNELLKVQRETLKEVQELSARLTRNATNPSATELDKVKALQWMVDNWPQR